MKRKNNTERGTTLLELMFSLFIFGTLLTVMAIFPTATRKSITSTNDMRATIIGESIRDAVKTAMESAYRQDNSQTPPILVKIVHDGLFTPDPEAEEGEEGEEPQVIEGELTIELPTTAEESPASVETGNFRLHFTNNEYVRYPIDENEVFKLGQDLLDESSPFYDKDDKYHDYSFDIEIRQALKVRRPEVDGVIDCGSPIRIYKLIPRVYEFNIRIYRNWRPRNVEETEKNLANARQVHHFRFEARLPELSSEED